MPYRSLPLFFLLSAMAASAAARDGGASGVPKIPVSKYKLPNGLEVIVAEDHRLPVVAVNLWYHVGPANEEPGRTGFAHLFEHMMFQGSKHVEHDAHFRLLQQAGGTNMNGTTDFDRTNYFETVPSNQLELALWLESDRMGYLLDMLDQAKLSNQQDVVRNERRQTTENVPYGIVEEGLFHQLFPATHPYYADVIGSHADIQAARLDDVRNFFHRYYAPNNATVAVVGDVDAAHLRTLVSKYFGSLKRGADVSKPHVVMTPITTERRATIQDHIELQREYMAWVTPPIFSPGDAEAAIAAHILGGGKSSRLYRSLVYEKQIAQDVRAWYEPLELGSIFCIQATARKGHTAAELEPLISEELERFERDGPTDEELGGARNTVETRLMSRLETVGGEADLFNYYNHYLGKPDYLGQDLARYAGATAAGVRAFAQQQLRASSRVVVQAIPGTPDLGPAVPITHPEPNAASQPSTPANADELWRKQMPAAAPARAMQLPTPQIATLPNGLSLMLAPRSALPLVSAQLVLHSGSDANPLDKPGLAEFTAVMLDQGTATRSATQIAAELARLGATLSIQSSMDSVSLTVRALKRNFPQALDILADVLLHPSFPEMEIERQRAIRLGSLVQQRNQAAVVADQVAEAALYGPEHPYAYPEIGTEASVRAIQQKDLAGYWKQFFTPENAALVVGGDFTTAELQGLAAQEFGGWQRGAAAQRTLASPGEPTVHLVLVDKPGSAQTQLRVVLPGAPRSTPDYPALELMNTVLGGVFNSRINMNLREEKGYTYGANSRFTYRRAAGPFMVRTGVRTDVTAPALAEILKEIRRMPQNPVTPEELQFAKSALILSLPGRFETTSQLVNSFASLFVYGLAPDYYTKLPSLFSEVSSQAVQAVVEKYLRPEKILVVAVGDRAQIEQPLDQLGLGTFQLRSPDSIDSSTR